MSFPHPDNRVRVIYRKKAGQIVLHAADRFIGRAYRGIDVGLEPIRSDRFWFRRVLLVTGTIS